MSGLKEIDVRAVEDRILANNAARRAEIGVEIARLRGDLRGARDAAGSARSSLADVESRHSALRARLSALQAELDANTRALTELARRSVQVADDLASTIKSASGAAGSADRAASEVDADRASLEQARRGLEAALVAARSALDQHDLSQLTPARRAADEADAQLSSLQARESESLAVLAALSADPTMGALVDAMVAEAASVGLTVERALAEGTDWEITFRDAEQRLFRLAAEARGAVEVAARDHRIAVLIGDSAESDAQCAATVRALLERLRKRGVFATARTGPQTGAASARQRSPGRSKA